MKKHLLYLSFLVLLLLISPKGYAQQLIVFPGAEGAGKITEGGRGGDVYHATSIEDSGLD